VLVPAALGVRQLASYRDRHIAERATVWCRSGRRLLGGRRRRRFARRLQVLMRSAACADANSDLADDDRSPIGTGATQLTRAGP